MKMQNWTTDNIKDQKGRVAIVTGSSSGIGLETARELASKGATAIIAVRDLDKGGAAAENIRSGLPEADLEVMELDLADLGSVERFAVRFLRGHERLDLLINNAGVMIPPYSKTADGFELQFGTNHLGHFALTSHLYPLLAATEASRIVNVSSSAHRYGELDFDDLDWEARKYAPWKAYGDSKIANLYFTYELQRRARKSGDGIRATAAHPGWTATDLQRHSGLIGLLNHIFAQDTKMGALPTLRAALDNALAGGDYIGPGGFMEMRGYPVKVEPKELARDARIAKELWEVSEQLTGQRFETARSATTDG